MLTLTQTSECKPFEQNYPTRGDTASQMRSGEDNSSDIYSSINRNQIYTRFSKEKPTLPPWVDASLELELQSTNTSRGKRSVGSSQVGQSVCDSISEWVEIDRAEDMFGNTVQVVKNIQSGNTRIGQYFYETFCADDGNTCRGINESRYNSKCETKHIFTYAQVRTSSNETGWMYIKIRGSCNCMLYSKHTNPRMSIWDELLKR